MGRGQMCLNKIIQGKIKINFVYFLKILLIKPLNPKKEKKRCIRWISFLLISRFENSSFKTNFSKSIYTPVRHYIQYREKIYRENNNMKNRRKI